MHDETSSSPVNREAAMRHIQGHLDSMEEELKQLQKVSKDASDSKSGVISRYGEKLRSDLMSGSFFGNPESIKKDEIIKNLRKTVEELQSTCSTELNDDKAPRELSPKELRELSELRERSFDEVVIPTLSSIYRTVTRNGVNASGYINPLLSREDCSLFLPDGDNTMGVNCGVTDLEDTHGINIPLDHETAMGLSYISEKTYGSLAYFWKTDLAHSAFTIYDYIGALNLMSQRTVTKDGTHHPLNAIYLGDTYMCKLHLKYPTEEAASRLFDHERINRAFWYFRLVNDLLSKRVQIMNEFLGDFGSIEIVEYINMDVDLSNFESYPRPGELTARDEEDYLGYVPGVYLGPIPRQMIALYGKNGGSGTANSQSEVMNQFEIRSAIEDVMINVSEFIERKDLKLAVNFLSKLFKVVSKNVDLVYEALFMMYRGDRTSVKRHDVVMKRFMHDNFENLFNITNGQLRDDCIDDIRPVGFPHMRNALRKLVTKYILVFVMVKIYMGPAKFDSDLLGTISEFDKDIHEYPLDGDGGKGRLIVVFPPLKINDIRTKSQVLPFED